MFLHHDGHDEAVFLIPQVSHAWLAWQIASHWGNRSFPRPGLRAELLAAVLLHDSGWVDSDAAPEVDDSGRPRSFDRMQASTHLAIWRASVSRVAAHSRYAALLVASHFAWLASLKCRDALDRGDTGGARVAQAFIAEMERLQSVWRESLSADPRYRDFVAGKGREANQALLAACDRISVFLCARLATEFDVQAPTTEGSSTLHFKHLGDSRWRVHPWPLQGTELEVHCEARRLSATRFADSDELRDALQQAPSVRLAFRLQRSSAG